MALRFFCLVLFAAKTLAQTITTTTEEAYPVVDFPGFPPGGELPRTDPFVTTPRTNPTTVAPAPTTPTTTQAETTSTTKPTTTTSIVEPASTISSNFVPNEPFVNGTGNDRISLTDTSTKGPESSYSPSLIAPATTEAGSTAEAVNNTTTTVATIVPTASAADPSIKETTLAHVLTDGGPPPGQTVGITVTKPAKSQIDIASATEAITNVPSQEETVPSVTPQTISQQINNTVVDPSSADGSFITEQMYETTDVASVLEETTKPSVPTTTGSTGSLPAITVPEQTTSAPQGPTYDIANQIPPVENINESANPSETSVDQGFELNFAPPPPPSLESTDPFYDSGVNEYPEIGKVDISAPSSHSNELINPGKKDIYPIDLPNPLDSLPPVVPVADKPSNIQKPINTPIPFRPKQPAVRYETSNNVQALYDENSKFVANLNPFSSVSQNSGSYNLNNIFLGSYIPGQPIWQGKEPIKNTINSDANPSYSAFGSSRTSIPPQGSNPEFSQSKSTIATTNAPMNINPANDVRATYELWNALLNYHLGPKQNVPSGGRQAGSRNNLHPRSFNSLPSPIKRNNDGFRSQSNQRPPSFNPQPSPINTLSSNTNNGGMNSQSNPSLSSFNSNPSSINTRKSNTQNGGIGSQSNQQPPTFNPLPPQINKHTSTTNNGGTGSQSNQSPASLNQLPPHPFNTPNGGTDSQNNILPPPIDLPPPPPPPPFPPVVVPGTNAPVPTEPSMGSETASTYRRIFRTVLPITADPNIVKSTEPQLNLNIPTLAYEEPSHILLSEANSIADIKTSIPSFLSDVINGVVAGKTESPLVTEAKSDPFIDSLSNPMPPPIILDVTTTRTNENNNLLRILSSTTTTTPTAAPNEAHSQIDTTTETAAPELSIEQMIAYLEKTQEDSVFRGELPSSVCQCKDYVNNVCYVPEAVCNRFVQCVKLGDKIRAYERECGLGNFWNPATLACQKSDYVDCPTDPCRDGKIDRHPYHGRCRAYWQCLRRRSTINCCSSGYRYSDIESVCDPDETCVEECTLTKEVIKKPPSISECPLKTEEGSRIKYRMGQHVLTCAGGTIFDQTQCTCVIVSSELQQQHPNDVPTEECNPDIVIDFNGTDATAFKDKSGRRHGIGDKRVVVTGKGGLFYGSGRVDLWRYSNAEMGNLFAIFIRFNPYGRSKKLMTLLSNCDRTGERHTIDIRLDPWTNTITYRLTTFQEYKIEAKYQPFRLNEAIMVYNQGELTVSTNKHISSIGVIGSIPQRHQGIQIGGCNLQDGYRGYVDEVIIYNRCIPPEYKLLAFE